MPLVFIRSFCIPKLRTYNNIYFHAVEFDSGSYHPSFYSQFHISMPTTIKKSVQKRQAEFLSGRICAKKCLEEFEMGSIQVDIALDRAPIWPGNILGSISHSNQIAIAVCSQDPFYQAVGIDVEKIFDSQQALEIQEQIVNKQELLVAKRNDIEHSLFVTIAFSAKESLFKAIYRYVGHFFNFDAATVESICQIHNRVHLILTEDLTVSLRAGTQYHLDYYQFGENILTVLLYKKIEKKKN